MTTIFPIREISTYNGKNWTIKARVTSKSQVRSFANDRGNGKVFSVDLLDKDGGEIKASFFNSSCDKFFDMLDVGSIYTMSRGNVKVANKRYSSSKHNYEINFDADAVIVASADDHSIESVKYSFVRIREISTKMVPGTVDLIGVVRDAKPLGKVQSKNGGEELTRRTIVLVDDSECAIEVTLWQDFATKFDDSVLSSKPVIAIKGASIREYNGARSAGTLQQSILEVVTPESAIGATDAGKHILSWFGTGPSVSEYFNLSSTAGGADGAPTPGGPDRNTAQTITSMADMKEECKRGFFGDKGIYFDCIGKLAFVSTKIKDTEIPIYYSACPGCNRKLSEDGTNKCFACDKTVAKPSLRFLFRGQFIDHSDQGFLTVFDAQGAQILKRSAEDLIAEAGNQAGIPDQLKKAFFEKTYLLRVKAVGQEYKGEVKPRISVISAEPVDPVSMGRRLMKKIIQKVGIEKTPTIQEEEPVTAEPDHKKMRMDIEMGTAIESKE